MASTNKPEEKEPMSTRNRSRMTTGSTKMLELRQKVLSTRAKREPDSNKSKPTHSPTKAMWSEIEKAGHPHNSLNSKVIQGMKSGALDPDIYGRFMVQDVAYCANGALNWKNAEAKARKSGDIDFADYCKVKYQSYEEFASGFASDWGIDPKGVLVNKACAQYIFSEAVVLEELPSAYITVVNYACYQLYPWLALRMSPVSEGNVYGDWISENSGFGSAESLTVEMDELVSEKKLDMDLVKKIVTNYVICEGNLFRSITGDEMTPLLPWPETPQ